MVSASDKKMFGSARHGKARHGAAGLAGSGVVWGLWPSLFDKSKIKKGIAYGVTT
jgi:hypothetical protein